MTTVKLLISALAAINFSCVLDPAALAGRRLLEARRLLEVRVAGGARLTYNSAQTEKRGALDTGPIRDRLLLEARRLLEVLR